MALGYWDTIASLQKGAQILWIDPLAQPYSDRPEYLKNELTSSTTTTNTNNTFIISICSSDTVVQSQKNPVFILLYVLR